MRTDLHVLGLVTNGRLARKLDCILADTVGRLRFYAYYRHNKDRTKERIFWCIATSLLDADIQCLATTGIDPSRDNSIGCRIVNNSGRD